MKIDENTISRLATLSKLEFNPEETKKIERDLERILSFVDKLKELDTSGVEPLIFMSDEVNVLRDDIVKQVITHEEGMKNAVKKDSDYFKVPKVIE